MAQHLNVSVSGFYDWLRNRLSRRSIQFNQNSIFVKLAHQETQESYGHVRLTKHLQAQGIAISQHAVRKSRRSTSCIVKGISVLNVRRTVIISDRSMTTCSINSLR